VTLDQAEFWRLLPELIWHEDEPIAHPSSVALYRVSKLAAEHVKVVLTGEGADETLAGYNRYRVTMLNLRFGRAFERVVPSGVRQGLAAALREGSPRSRTLRRLSRTFLGLPSDLDALYFDNFAVFDRARQRDLLSDGVKQRVGLLDPYAVAHAAFASQAGTSSLLRKLLYTDTKTYLHELLMKQDQMSMAASIESRVPFLDHPLVEWVTGLPDEAKLKGVTTKVVLRESMRTVLPASILTRPKMGFPVPIGRWLRQPVGRALQELLRQPRTRDRKLFQPDAVERLITEHAAGADHWQRIWMLLNIELWLRIFMDREPVESVTRDFLSLSST
jgi:asparagine synthase (glutamine-hydrolysing)